MALHTDLPIYRTGVRLLDLAVKVQVQMPRTVKRALGEKITQHCVDMLDLMALANATQRQARTAYIEQLLAGLHLQINPRKTILQPVVRGVDFVGHLAKPWRRITRRRTVHAAMDRVQQAPAADLHQTANSYFGLMRQASHSHHDRTRLAHTALQRGHVVAGDMTKIFRRPA